MRIVLHSPSMHDVGLEQGRVHNITAVLTCCYLGAAPQPQQPLSMHIVVAMYREDPAEVAIYLGRVLSIASVRDREPLVYVYVKGGLEVAAHVAELGIAHKVVALPNIGLEQGTYLQHVVSHYDDLPAHVLFTQALPNGDSMVLERLQTYFGSRTGLLGLGVVATCTCEGHSWYWSDDTPGGFIRLREVWVMALGTFCPHEFACFHNGFILASRGRLQVQPRRVYEYLLSLFPLHKSNSLRRSDTVYAHLDQEPDSDWQTLAHVMERSWNALLNCTSPDVARACADACDAQHQDCTVLEQCQCLDPVQASAGGLSVHDGEPQATVVPLTKDLYVESRASPVPWGLQVARRPRKG